MSKIKITDLLDDLIARVPEKNTISYIAIFKDLMYELLKEQVPQEIRTSVRLTNYKGCTLIEEETMNSLIHISSSPPMRG
jgi:hypothetical protein